MAVIAPAYPGPPAGYASRMSAQPEPDDHAPDEHPRELLRLIKGSPQPELSVQSLAERIGIPEGEAEAMIEDLIRQGRLVREGDRLLVVERAASAADPGQDIP